MISGRSVTIAELWRLEVARRQNSLNNYCSSCISFDVFVFLANTMMMIDDDLPVLPLLRMHFRYKVYVNIYSKVRIHI